MRRLFSTRLTDSEVMDYFMRFLGSNPFEQIISQTILGPLAHNFAALQTTSAVMVDCRHWKRKFV